MKRTSIASGSTKIPMKALLLSLLMEMIKTQKEERLVVVGQVSLLSLSFLHLFLIISNSNDRYF